jgi:hypothetical protein
MTNHAASADTPKFMLLASSHAQVRLSEMTHQGIQGHHEQHMHGIQAVEQPVHHAALHSKGSPSACAHTPVLQDCMLLAAGGVIRRDVCNSALPPKYVARLSVDWERRPKQFACSHMLALVKA